MNKGERLASASQLLIHSGNIASWSKLRKKGVLTTTDEVSVNLSAEKHMKIEIEIKLYQ